MRSTATIIQYSYEAFACLPVDETLTVLADEEQGYEWGFDVGKFSSPEIIALAIRLVKDEGYKVGQARRVLFGRKEQERGVYKPLPNYGKRTRAVQNKVVR